jgi:tetraacyldisaccharide 4'-kinase
VTARGAERIWYGEGWRDRVARGVLAPLGWGYAAVASARNALYDRGVLRSHVPALPVLSLGNLSVGGTGKTPVAAWAAARLRAAGAHPAIVLRGYGDDEPLVHVRLNPEIIVVTDADRVRGVEQARVKGADCAVLDDAFQHRRIRRTAEWVLVSAEQWREGLRSLPAGPLREPVASLWRADVLLVTRKSAPRELADEIGARLAPLLRDRAAVAVCHLAPYAIVDARTSAREPLSWLNGRELTAVAAIGAPAAFFSQLAAQGAALDPLSFDDHHAFSAGDVARIVRSAARRAGVICTLKDAVKLVPLWPPQGPPLWYVSQRAVVERGGAVLDASLEIVLRARAAVPPTAGSAGSSSPAHGHRPSTADR